MKDLLYAVIALTLIGAMFCLAVMAVPTPIPGKEFSSLSSKELIDRANTVDEIIIIQTVE